VSLTFNEERHEYRWEGKVVPSVTQVLGGLYSFAGVPLDVLDAARERGGDVHLACQFYDEQDLDEDRLRCEQPNVWNYLCGWKRFIRDCNATFGQIEQPVYHTAMRYAGTPDRMGARLLYKGVMVNDAQIDIKTSVDAHPCWGVQTMAYSHAVNIPNQRRFTVQLRDDPKGDYRLIEWPDPADWPVFVSLLTLRTFKERHKL
jgi:hypothetical protein